MPDSGRHRKSTGPEATKFRIPVRKNSPAETIKLTHHFKKRGRSSRKVFGGA